MSTAKDKAQKKPWPALINLINLGRRFLITTHINPDGDAIGSEMALFHILRNLGKQVSIINESSTPYYLRFLDPQNIIKALTLPADTPRLTQLPKLDGIFILDISEWDRLGRMRGLIQSNPAPKICLDHHPAQEQLAEISIVDEEACNTGILVFELIAQLGITLTKSVAEALYVALLTDTGSFRFSNTDVKAHQMAAQLIKAGVVSHEIYSKIYEQGSWNRVKLLGSALSSIQSCCQEKVAYLVISQELLNSYGVHPDEIEGFVEFPRMIEGVEVVILFFEREKEKIRISLRSKGKVDVQEIANSLGGGGHPYAAGIRLEKPLSQAISSVLTVVQEKFQKS
jgi:phosphoesterase RecJ-like protein